MPDTPTALITGANRGIGLEFVAQMLRRGYRVFATCRSPESADELRQLRQTFKQTLDIISLDIDRADDRRSLVAYLRQTHENLDLLINNAGVAAWDSLTELNGEVILDVVKTNALSPLLLSRDLLPFMARSSNPRVIMMSSRLGSMTLAKEIARENFAYAVSKAALNMVTVQLAQAVAAKKVAVIAQSPGWVRTDMGGQDAPLSVSEAVRSMLGVIGDYTFADSGKFFSETGEEIAW